MAQDVTDHGAVGDGSTDDTAAIRAAADAASPGGTVYFPAGTYLVGSNSPFPLDYPMDGSWDNLTWKGESFGSTVLQMVGGQSRWHMMFRARSSDGSQMTGVRFEQLTMDMNGSQQSGAPGSGWFRVYDGSGTFTMRDCVIKNSLNFGVQLGDDIAGDFKYCQFSRCGDPDVSAGHALNLNQSSKQTTNISWCLIEDSAGTDIDIGDDTTADYQTVIVERSYFSAGLGAVKIDPGNLKTVLRNTYIAGGSRTTRGIKTNNDNYDCGSLELEDVVIENCGGPGIDLGGGGHGTLTLNQVAVRNVENDGMRSFGGYSGMGIYAEGVDLGTSGTISVHNVSPNNDGIALFFDESSSGSIEEVRHDGTSGIGSLSSVTVGTAAAGSTQLKPDTVAKSEVGPRTSESTTDGTNESEETTEETSGSINLGNLGGYNQPAEGVLDWHIPLNENFQSIESDIISLAEKVNELENN
ncbi:hypothetical protein HISP_18990 (plasmid) [Haloarcula hispanica N601]|uniref:Uncharacterized protein n=3 Tax=Haloarculaceae TaxID=1963268 RepID=V5TUH6_HALHI|nr:MULTISPECIES: glycosyl hydrolase family 28-related protein [Haloarcula]AEM59297.1 hypothetical protein HAH_5164 [Haloarcula hispanica ATCC 33960]AHB68350.1 hypothetical protein HISP_18990 [Haloarcula hispanica N601]KAA9404506.1 hypothetical protein Har1131_17160 [Haloarcula sp. CBA1131]